MALSSDDDGDKLPFEVEREIVTSEYFSRVDIQSDEVAARRIIAQGRVSLSDPDMCLCPHPEPEVVYTSFLRRRRLELTEKYQHLVTRQFLRENHWLEATVAMLQEVVEDEIIQRDRILIESQRSLPKLTLYHMQLQMISAKGTEGTVIFVEEVEREVRFRVVYFDEVQAFDQLTESETVSRSDALKREQLRLAAEHDDRGVIGAAEWNERWTVEREEEKAWFVLTEKDAPSDKHRIYELLLWRVMCAEAEARWAIEASEHRALFERYGEDECDGEFSHTTLSWFVAHHEGICGAAEAVVRQQRAESHDVQVMVALAFHLEHPVVATSPTVPRTSASINPDEKGSVENSDDSDVITVFGCRLPSTAIPTMRPAGTLPMNMVSAATMGTSPCKGNGDNAQDKESVHQTSPPPGTSPDEGCDDESDDDVGTLADDVHRKKAEICDLWSQLTSTLH